MEEVTSVPIGWLLFVAYYWLRLLVAMDRINWMQYEPSGARGRG